jgi:DNA repair protein RecO (recombination protein O)
LRRLEDEAHVLRTQELGDADLIVSLLAERHGRVRGVARAARRSRRRFGGALEPLTLVRAAWVEKEGRDLHRIEMLECRRSYAPMQAEPAVQAACAVLAELSDTFVREGEPSERFFKLIGASLDALERGCDVFAVVRYVEFWTLRLHGLAPDLSTCSECAAPLGSAPSVVRGPGAVCASCARTSGEMVLSLDAAARRFLDRARREPPSVLAGRSEATLPGRVLEILLRGTLESFAERRFRTYRHLAAAGIARDGRSDR